MTLDNHFQDKLSELRSQAEAVLPRKGFEVPDVSALSTEEIQDLVHELHVYQIELEMQNVDLRQSQIKMEELKDRYLDLYDFAPVGYMNLNDKGLILEANLAAVRLLGVERTSLINMFFSHFVYQEFMNAYFSYLKQVFESQSKQTCEIKLTRKDGTIFHAQLESVSVQDESRHHIHCQTILLDITDRKLVEEELKKARDELEARVKERTTKLLKANEKLQVEITERKRAEEELRESEEKYRAVFENAAVGINLLDRQGRIVEVNQALSSMLGYSVEELLELTFSEITYPDDSEISRRNLEVLMAGDIDSYRLEKRYIGKDGGVLWVDLSTSSIRDTNGEHVGTVGVIADITERKLSEEALRESEHTNRLLIEQAPIGIGIMQDGVLTQINPRFLDVFGYDGTHEVLGLPVEDFYSPEDRSLITQRCKDRLSGKPLPVHYEVRGLKKNGESFDL